MIDLTRAARRTADLIAAVPDERLDAPTPCEKTSLAQLVVHVDGLSQAFTWAAHKDPAMNADAAPSLESAELEPGWRERVPERLAALAEAWRDPAAWEGMTRAGGVDLPGEVAGLVALNEVVVHGWDIARALDRPYDVTREEAEACLAFVAETPEDPEPGNGLFGPPVPVPAEAPILDRLIGRTGRDPFWTP
ncbi:TIGR03086 family metal-binding protein [Actinomadura sp. 21ATH]|uniref:TIGR03086 family metal-binding protein n=1 Tax=Actinomadura sp. 21ATH TaxID=1735444 RepID=UPI0035C00AB9